MSFITKRERVFNEYELFDLPPRNEGKLKAYASCTDARAWSHFCSDKTEHLVEVIKRNNETCRPKYVPTHVIVDTLMVAKNAEITRLKRKIEEFERMLAVYDQLELSSEQKNEIANAYATIKAANKELDDLCLDLDLSGFTEGMESDVFETGKSRGDEPSRYKGDETVKSKGSESMKSRGDEWSFGDEEPLKENKSNQAGLSSPRDVCVSAHDPRIQDMQDAIIRKDAKLNAMQNTIAVLENDVCEPYCIYAHIYTALEEIFVVLCQNDKYKLYLSFMTAGQDTRCIDIKGKILYKLKVLEKFSLALIAPCSHQSASASRDCACLRAEVIARIDTTLSVPYATNQCLDNKRAQLVADIMENNEMTEILSKESTAPKNEDDLIEDSIDNYSIEEENLRRLKNLQENYEKLMTYHEKLQYEKGCLQMRCHRYEDLENELEALRSQLREYNILWNEKEHYKRRSLDIDSLKEQYIILADETSNLETQLKAESEINHLKTHTIDELRNENRALEKKLNEALITFEKEKNVLECKLKETDCTILCQEQQIRSLTIQIDKFLEQGKQKMFSHDEPSNSLLLLDKIESQKDQIKHLQDALYCSEDEKQQLQDEFQEKLKIITGLKMEIEDWRSTYEKAVQRNNYLEKYAENYQNDIQKLVEENKTLSQDVQEKANAIKNLINVVENKSHEVQSLSEDVDKKENCNNILYGELQQLREMYDNSVASFEDEKVKALESIHQAKLESLELIKKVKDYSTIALIKDDIPKSFESTSREYKNENYMIVDSMKENTNLQRKLSNYDNNKFSLLQEIESLREINSFTLDNLEREKNEYKNSLELSKKESEVINTKLSQYLTAHENLVLEKNKLEIDLSFKKRELEMSVLSLELCKKESNDLLKKYEDSTSLEDKLKILNETHQKLQKEKLSLQNQLLEKTNDVENLIESVNNQKETLLKTSRDMKLLENEQTLLKKAYDELLTKKEELQHNFYKKSNEIVDLQNKLEKEIEENTEITETLKSLKLNQECAKHNINTLEQENFKTISTLHEIKQENDTNKKKYEKIEDDYKKLKIDNNRLHEELDRLMTVIKSIEQENTDLSNTNQNLELSLINTKKQIYDQHAGHRISYEEVLRELEELKNEKRKSYNSIRELLKKLDESDNIISRMNEDILERDDKISTLEIQINHLEEEITKLQDNLLKAINAGEEIKDSSYEKYTHSLNTIEAHHSKAAHNIQLELAELSRENSQLEKQLSVTKLRTKESNEDKSRYLSQIQQLLDEKEMIISDIKGLELKSVGESSLVPRECSVKDILLSLERINKSFDIKFSKSASLEQTILKVQTSSQLLLSKADEAKKIVEKEKQKIIMEKEEAIKDRLNMEKKVEELNKKLQYQIKHDDKEIQDLQATILDQKLINNSTQGSINKLKEQLQELQNLYDNSRLEISNFKETVHKLTEENIQYLNINKKLKTDLDFETNNIQILHKEIGELKCKPSFENIGIQVKLSNTSEEPQNRYFNITQIDIGTPKTDRENYQPNLPHVPNIQADPANPIQNKIHNNILTDQNIKNVPNEVQILTANVEPSFNFVRSSYLNYKMAKLESRQLEQYSIYNEETDEQKSVQHLNGETSKNCLLQKLPATTKADHNISINIMDEEVNRISALINNPQNPSCNTDFIGSQNEVTTDDLKVINQSVNSADKDILVDSKESSTDHNYEDVNTIEQLRRMSETYSEQSKMRNKKSGHTKNANIHKRNEIENNSSILTDKNTKAKLRINLPRVDSNYRSVDSIPDFVYSISSTKLTSQEMSSLHTTLGDEDQFSGSYNSFRLKSDEEKEDLVRYSQNKGMKQFNKKKRDLSDQLRDFTGHPDDVTNGNVKSLSHYELARVKADSFIMKPEKNINYEVPDHTNKTLNRNFALDYILDTVQREGDINNTKILMALKETRKIKSDEHLSAIKISETTVSSTYKYSPLRLSSSLEFKTTIKNSSSIEANNSAETNSGKERGILTTNDSNNYEAKIKHLTKSLQMTENDYKQKLEAIKSQYDSNIKKIINEHNQGVKNIQGLHEEMLQNILKNHENEVENLRTMSIEANRKAEKLEKENKNLKNKLQDNSSTVFQEEHSKMVFDCKKRRKRTDPPKILTKTDVKEFSVSPKIRSHGPCTCSLDVHVTDTLRNMFEQVDVNQRKMAELTFLKHIANKIADADVESLDTQELSFLHLKVCRTWKSKLSKDEAFKTIDNLQTELLNRHMTAKEHFAELDRKVEVEKQRLQEVKELVCQKAPSPTAKTTFDVETNVAQTAAAEKEYRCDCKSVLQARCNLEVRERQSAGDLVMPGKSPASVRPKKTRTESNRAVLAKVDVEEKRDRKLYNDEPPTRLRRIPDRPPIRYHKK